MKISKVLFGLGICWTVLCSSPQQSAAQELAVSPMAFQYFCAANPTQCSVVPGTLPRNSAGLVKATDALLKDLQAVKAYVYDNFRQVQDGKVDTWTLLGKKTGIYQGDCEDMAATTRDLLIQRGWPSSALLFSLGTQLDGENHVVLVVRTDRGDLVMDNRTRSMMKASQLRNFEWKTLQSAKNPRQFYRVSH